MDNFTKNKLINELKEAVKHFYNAKRKKDKEKIKYYKGFSEGIMIVLIELNIITKEDIQRIIYEYDQKTTYSFRDDYKDIKLNDIDSPSIYRKLKNIRYE